MGAAGGRRKAKLMHKGLRLNAPPGRVMRDRRLRRRRMRERWEMQRDILDASEDGGDPRR